MYKLMYISGFRILVAKNLLYSSNHQDIYWMLLRLEKKLMFILNSVDIFEEHEKCAKSQNK